MKLMISAVALSRLAIASFALAYLLAPCSALAANMFEPISSPTSSVPAIICMAPTDMITTVISPVKNISKFAVLSLCRLRLILCAVSTIMMIMNMAAISAAVQFIYNNTIKKPSTKGQSSIQLVVDDDLMF